MGKGSRGRLNVEEEAEKTCERDLNWKGSERRRSPRKQYQGQNDAGSGTEFKIARGVDVAKSKWSRKQ